MAKIRYSDAAKADLEQIGDYISEKLKSPVAALNTVNKIQDAVDKLEEFPFMGASMSSIVKADTDYRFLVSGNYLVFYHADSNNVYIDRILYGRRDYLQILFGALPEDGE
jgi:addiction module RelE/StbE family toxin